MEEKIINEKEEKRSLSFVEQFVKEDLEAGKNGGRLQTRFPPEPNGYIHIGHAKAICMDFGVAERFGGVCNLRFDDTNPSKEDTEYVDSILHDIEWLGFKWGNLYYASDYFEKLWDLAVWMIKQGLAYVDEQTSEQIAEQKGTPTQPGVASPFRDRPIEENLRLFEHMNTAEAVEGSMVLRAKLDMANPNMHFRDPVIYRIIQTPHHRTGTKWHAYPMYDFAHGQSDYFEGVTHSICTLEFVPHRPLYDKFVDLLQQKDEQHDYRPRQIEFNRLNLTYTVMSKRKLKALVDEKLVSGWVSILSWQHYGVFDDSPHLGAHHFYGINNSILLLGFCYCLIINLGHCSCGNNVFGQNSRRQTAKHHYHQNKIQCLFHDLLFLAFFLKKICHQF